VTSSNGVEMRVVDTGNDDPETGQQRDSTFSVKLSSCFPDNDQYMQGDRDISIRMFNTVTNKFGLTNSISTTKYTCLSWLPVSLLEQFKKIANVYFLVISILMLIGQYATYIFTTPLDAWSTVLTLVFVLLVTCFKEAIEDLGRFKSDYEENYATAIVVRYDQASSVFVEIEIDRCDIKAGDIIKLNGKSRVPADMLLILTSNYKDGNNCFIETANIDGETNLKVREAPASLLKCLPKEVKDDKPSYHLFNGDITFEPPNKNIHNFTGSMELNIDGIDTIPLSNDNILLRGSVFCNTDWCYGVAIYTGKETKVQMCSKAAETKVCNLDKEVNTAIKIIFLFQVILVSISVISVFGLHYNDNSRFPYIFGDGEKRASVLPLWLEQWFVFFILYNNCIPISLYVTIEVVNLGQSYLISGDQEIYQPDLDMPTVVRTSSLCQELGMVSNIFSDKTGTLTRNEMKLVQFYISGKQYYVDNNPENPIIKNTKNLSDEFGTVVDPNQRKLLHFLQCLTTCHTVVREKDGKYRAESPDELALVEGVGCFNCNLLERGTAQMDIEFLGEKQTYEILAVNAFNSDRKRMSILLKNTVTQEYIVYCKGADNIMLSNGICTVSASELAVINDNLNELAVQSLRTLCIAERIVPQEEAELWLARYRDACSSMTDRAGLMAAAAAALELDMELLGITAIEDKLQDQVPEVIAELAEAGIVLWMLTGDKLETAVNIGKSCNLIVGKDTKLQVISDIRSKEQYYDRLKEIYDDMMDGTNGGARKYMVEGTPTDVVLVMDGPSYSYFYDVGDPDDPSGQKNKDERKWLLFVGQNVRSVIGCRLTPKQKADIVTLVKNDTVPAATCLAIGDGANDVPMIQAGNVGVGIFGKEGRQAANNADFAIGEFKFLRRLLLLHGRWNYVRQSRVFLYSMHKNLVITLTLFWFGYYDALSGTSPYESWVYTSFNFALGLPIIFYGIMDRDLSESFVLRNPTTYITGKSNTYLKPLAVVGWIINAVLYAVLLCLLFYLTCKETFRFMSLYEMGTTLFMGLVMALQGKIAFMHHQWTKPQVNVQIATFFFLMVWFLALSTVVEDFLGVAHELYMQGMFWFYGFWSAPFFCTLIDVVAYYLEQAFFPSREMIMREAEYKELFEKDPIHTEFFDEEEWKLEQDWKKEHEHASISSFFSNITAHSNVYSKANSNSDSNADSKDANVNSNTSADSNANSNANTDQQPL